mgnify:CR=1 FL=1
MGGPVEGRHAAGMDLFQHAPDCGHAAFDTRRGRHRPVWIKGFGEHIAWAESSAVCYANSVMGARTNREGGPSALAAALTGMTVEYGYHLEENRRPVVTVEVSAEMSDPVHFGALGQVLGVIGSAIAVGSVTGRSLLFFLAGLVLVGLARSAVDLSRFAAAEVHLELAVVHEDAAPHDLAGLADALHAAAAQAEVHGRLAFAHCAGVSADEVRRGRRAGDAP